MAAFTPTEYNNICKLLQYLRAQLHTPMGGKYYHGSYNTCTIGFAAKSGLFKDTLPISVEDTTEGNWNLIYKGRAEHHSNTVFGELYTRVIAVPYNDVVMNRPDGKQQLAYVIEKIENLLRENHAVVPRKAPDPKPPKAPKVNKPNPATAGKRIEARIARMKKIKEDIAKLGADAKFFTVHQADMDEQIAMLEDALNS